jgi:hypothetical protein
LEQLRIGGSIKGRQQKAGAKFSRENHIKMILERERQVYESSGLGKSKELFLLSPRDKATRKLCCFCANYAVLRKLCCFCANYAVFAQLRVAVSFDDAQCMHYFWKHLQVLF